MSEEKLRDWLLFAGTLFLLTFCLAPFIYMALTSLSTRADFLARGSSFDWTLRHYQTVLFQTSLHFSAYLRNSLGVASLSAILGTGVAALAAFAITRLELP